MEIELINGSIIKLVGSDNVDSIVGTNPQGIIFTEFSLQKPEAWEYLRPILAENQGWAVFNGTSRGINHFYRMHKMAEKNVKWFHQYLTRDDTGVPSLEAIQDDREAGMPESLISQEYYNNWSASSEDVFIPLDIVTPAIGNRLRLTDYNFEARIMGVDVAYSAVGDSATIARRQGRMLHPIESYKGLDNMAFASRVVRRIKEFRPHAVFIDSGRGEGVISRLDQLGYGDIIYPVHFGGKTYDELYANKKSQMWARTRQWFLSPNKPCIDNDETLIHDLTTPFFDLNDKSQLQIESKKSLKSRGEKSGDKGDSVILTFAEEVSPDDIPSPEMERHGITPDMLRSLGRDREETYDLLSYMDTLTSDCENEVDFSDLLR